MLEKGSISSNTGKLERCKDGKDINYNKEILKARNPIIPLLHSSIIAFFYTSILTKYTLNFIFYLKPKTIN